MLKRTLIGLGAVGALAAAPTEVAARDVVQPISVSRTVNVGAGSSPGFGLRCSGTALALSGAVADNGFLTTRSVPDAARPNGWTFRFSGAGLRRPQRVRAELRCVSLRLPNGVRGVEVSVNTKRSRSLRVAPGRRRSSELRCDRGYVPTGYGLSRTGAVSIAAAVPDARGWSFVIVNAGARPARAELRIRCLERRVRASNGRALTFDVRHATFSDQVNARRRTLSHSCRRGEFSLATGLALDAADDVALVSAAPRGSRGARWSFRQASGSASVDTYLLCLSLASRFR